MTRFYCFPAGFNWRSHAPKEHVIVPAKVITEAVLDEDGIEIEPAVMESDVCVNTLEAVPEWADYEFWPETPRMIYA
jgi:hypothetical protein